MRGLSAQLLTLWEGHGAGMKNHQHNHCSSRGAAGWLQSHGRAFAQGPSCWTPALRSPPPKPTAGTGPLSHRGDVGQGQSNTTPASGFLRDKPVLPCPGSPHPNRIVLSTSGSWRRSQVGWEGKMVSGTTARERSLGQSNSFGGVILLKRKR